MALFLSLARSRQLPMVATLLVQLGAFLLACSGLAEAQSIHVSLRITQRDPPPSRVDEFPYRPYYSSHRFGQTAASPREEYHHRPVSGGGVHVNLRLTVKQPLQIPADIASAGAADNFAWVQRNNIISRCQYRSPHDHGVPPHRFKSSFPGEERIPFGNINIEEIENHVTRNSAMQNIFDSLASTTGLRADRVKLISNTAAEDRYSENPRSCSCGHDHAHASAVVVPQEISIPFDPSFFTSPSNNAAPHDDHDQARYRNQFHAYDHQNGGSNVGFMTVRDDGGAREGFSIPTLITGLQKHNSDHDGARCGDPTMSERAAEKQPRREKIKIFEPVYKKKQPKYHTSFV